MDLLVTRNFKWNLEDIEAFLQGKAAQTVFARLLDDLFTQIIPLLQQFPDAGADFFRHRPASQAVLMRTAQLRSRLGSELQLRELIHADFLILYAVAKDRLDLLSIRHHRQLSFDLYGSGFMDQG